ncbi:MAG: ASKHA domain-containing protein [Lachnospiraceae bacterium]|nr:ASKHA domain-containing protein [Lachnospiraceae bacterium]
MVRLKCAGCRKQNCNNCSLYQQINTNKKEASIFPGDFTPDGGRGFGMAFDVGTTTIAGLLWDLEKGVQLEAVTRINPGRYAGSDVVSRLTFLTESDGERERMQSLMAETLDDMAREAAQDSAKVISRETAQDGAKVISRVVIVGNTAMCEMILKEPLEGLIKAPFHKSYKGCRICTGRELGFSYLKEAQVIVLPAIEGFVGADALAVHTFIKHLDGRKNVLAVDIGTNGEILLFGKERTYACSAAAGPALEGAAVLCGMGALEGAVSEVRLAGRFPREDIYCKVIGSGPPKGICGSGLVDALALLKRIGVMDETGYLRTPLEARKAGAREVFCRRISSGQGENRFLLTDEENPVYLTAGDIRQLQLAKGAIRAGIEVLLQKEKLTEKDLIHIYIAGSFGSFIRKISALEIGLLPPVSPEKITSAGNCAGAGASMALLSERTVMEMEQDAEEICHVELADEEGFQACFLESLHV